MKKRGVTLIESIVVIALLGIIFLLVAPLIRTFGGVKNRAKTQTEIDAEFLVVNEFIQKKVRAAKSATGDYALIYNNLSDFPDTTTSGEGSVLYLNVPNETSTSDGVFFSFEKEDSTKEFPYVLAYREDIDGSRDILMKNVNEASFKFQEGIILYYIDLDIGIKKNNIENEKEIEEEKKFRSKFKGSASTRIDFSN